MGTGKSVLKNTLFLWVPQFINPLLSFVLVLIISRYMGVEGLGEYSLVMAYTGIFATVASLGLVSLVVREVAKRPREAHVFFFNASMFGTVSSIAALLAMNILVAVMGYQKELVQASLIMSFSLIASTAVMYMNGVFVSFEKSEYVAITYIVENIVRVGVCIPIVLYGCGLLVLFAALLGTRIFAFLLMFCFYVVVLGRPVCEFRPKIWRLLLKESPVFLNIAIFSTIHLNVDTIMLSKLADVEAVGIYSAAGRLLMMCTALPLAFSTALLPFLTRAYVAGGDRLRNLAASSCRYLFLGAFPLVIGTVVLGDQFITLIYGDRFVDAGPVLKLQIFSLIPTGLVFVLAQVLIATDNQKVDMTINMVCAGLNVVLNGLLIPFFAEMGAAAATLATIIVFNQLQYFYIKKRLFSIGYPRLMSKALAASVGMGVITYVLRDWNLFADVVISAAVYVVLLHFLKALSSEEIEFIKSLVRRRKVEE